MIKLPTEPIEEVEINPVVTILYGATKIGKTAVLADLEDNFIIDLERGATSYKCLRMKAKDYSEFREISTELHKQAEAGTFPYKYVTIDTIDRLVEWLEKEVVREWNIAQKKIKDPLARTFVTVYSEIGFGKGYDLVRLKMRGIINFMRNVTPHLILVGHLKRTIIGDTSVEVKEDNLDLVGKLRNLVCADADAVGYCYRGVEIIDDDTRLPALKVSFKADENTAAGSRRSHLRGKIITLSTMVEEDVYKSHWEKIYPE